MRRLKRKTFILIIISLMMIGFASITTALYINGDILYGMDKSKFTDNILFKSVTSEKGVEEISSDYKTISYETKSLDTIGETDTLSYEIVNNSEIYDASVKVSCVKDESEYAANISLTYNTDPFVLEAGTSQSKDLVVTLTKSVTSDVSVGITCSITASPLERESTAGVIDLDSYLYTIIKNQKIGTSDSIDFGYSSQYQASLDTTSSDYVQPGVYELKDENNVYFYRGKADNNYVVFGGFCWRAYRTTSTKGVKLIYNGTATDNKCTSPGNVYIGESVFNPATGDVKFDGYTYLVDGTETDSTIKKVIDDWFETNLSSKISYLEDTVFCNETSVLSDYSNVLSYSGTVFTAEARAGVNTKIRKPSTICPTKNDSYTVSTDNGNGKLKYPVGLITSDEQNLAGATGVMYSTGADLGTNYRFDSTYTLYNGGSSYWTMTPQQNNNMDFVYYNFSMYSAPVTNTYQVRPVISLKSGTTVLKTGDGSTSNPYVILES